MVFDGSREHRRILLQQEGSAFRAAVALISTVELRRPAVGIYMRRMSMSFNKWNPIPVREGALIAAGGALGAWYSPQLDPLSILYVVLLASFRGKAQSVVGAFTFSLLAITFAAIKLSFAHSYAEMVKLFAVICVMWICAICVPGATVDATAPPESEDAVRDRDKVWEAVLKMFPGWDVGVTG
jgi:hypothetical protein